MTSYAPGSKKRSGAKKVAKKMLKKYRSQQPASVKQRKNGATVVKKADGSKTVTKTNKKGVKVTTERNASGKKTSTTKTKSTLKNGFQGTIKSKSVTRTAGGKKTVSKSKIVGGLRPGAKRKTSKTITKKDGSSKKVVTGAAGKRTITKTTAKGKSTTTTKGPKKPPTYGGGNKTLKR